MNLSPEEFRALAGRALEILESYYRDLDALPVMPATSAEIVHDLLHEDLPRESAGIEETLAVVRDLVFPQSRHNGHRRFFGYVASPGTPVSAIGDMLTAGLNANVTSWRSSPSGTQLEHTVVDWFRKLVGYPEGGAGLLVSGGSMANFSGLAAMRAVKAPELGRSGANARLRIYVSEEAHFSIQKAARMLGIGSENVRTIETDGEFRVRLDELERAIQADREAGFVPACVVGNAGAVNIGAVDPLSTLADVAQRHGLWFHVDGAYGGFAAMAGSVAHLFAGIERADSVSLDPHKWLYQSVGCGCVLYRDAHAARAAFGHEAEYTRPVGLERDEAFAFWDFGPELSRPFRALSIWLQFQVYGAEAIAASVERNCDCARYLCELVEASEDFEMLAPVGLSIFCFRHVPRGYSGDLDALNERILVQLQQSGSSYVSNTRVRGKFALRGCVLNYRTEREDMARLLEDVRAAAARVLAS